MQADLLSQMKKITQHICLNWLQLLGKLTISQYICEVGILSFSWIINPKRLYLKCTLRLWTDCKSNCLNMISRLITARERVILLRMHFLGMFLIKLNALSLQCLMTQGTLLRSRNLIISSWSQGFFFWRIKRPVGHLDISLKSFVWRRWLSSTRA